MISFKRFLFVKHFVYTFSTLHIMGPECTSIILCKHPATDTCITVGSDLYHSVQ